MRSPETVPTSASPTSATLRRRVLLTGALSLAAYLALGYAVSASGLPDAVLLVAVAVLYVVLVRPMMRPVREASRLRRSLAYQAFLDGRAQDGPAPDGPAQDRAAQDGAAQDRAAQDRAAQDGAAR